MWGAGVTSVFLKKMAQTLQKKPVFALPGCQRMTVNTLLCDTLGLAGITFFSFLGLFWSLFGHFFCHFFGHFFGKTPFAGLLLRQSDRWPGDSHRESGRLARIKS